MVALTSATKVPNIATLLRFPKRSESQPKMGAPIASPIKTQEASAAAVVRGI